MQHSATVRLLCVPLSVYFTGGRHAIPSGRFAKKARFSDSFSTAVCRYLWPWSLRLEKRRRERAMVSSW